MTTYELLPALKIHSLKVSWLEMSVPNVYSNGFGDEVFGRYGGLGVVMGPHDGTVASKRQRDLSQRTHILSPHGMLSAMVQGSRRTLTSCLELCSCTFQPLEV